MERVAIVGSRKGADLEAVHGFMVALAEKHPDTIVVSGGADGVDKLVEQTWLGLGGMVESFRAVQLAWDTYGVEKWELGGASPRVYVLINEPTFADYVSALNYRDMLIAEASARLVAFYRPGRSRGAWFTAEWAQIACEIPVYEYEASGGR